MSTHDQRWRQLAATQPGIATYAVQLRHPVDPRRRRQPGDHDRGRTRVRAGQLPYPVGADGLRQLHDSMPPRPPTAGGGGGRKGCPLLGLLLLLLLPVLLPALAIHLLLRRTHPTHQTAPGGAPTPTPGPR